MVEMKRIRAACALLALVTAAACSNPYYERVEALVSGAAGDQVSLPVLSPSGGSYSVTQNVTATCSTSGAVIHITTDGSTPTVASTAYTVPIVVSVPGATMTIKAIAMKAGMRTSSVATAVITINPLQVSTPSGFPPGGTFSTDTLVGLACSTSGATIYWSTDGTAPKPWTPYTAPVSVAGNGTTMPIFAYATKAGMVDSTQFFASYTIAYPQVAAPAMTPLGGRLGHAQTVTLSSGTPGATIVYTLDGSAPSPTHGTTYSVPFTLPWGSTTLSAMAYKASMVDSGITMATFSEPVFLFTASASGQAVYSHAINLLDGSLSMAGTATLATQPEGLAVDPLGQWLYSAGSVVSPQVTEFAIDPASGTIPQVGSSGGTMFQAPVVDRTGHYLYVATGSLGTISAHTITPSSGNPVHFNNYVASGTTYGIAVSPTQDFLYVALTSASQVQGFYISPADGTLTAMAVAYSAGGAGTYGLAIDPAGKFLFAANQSGGTVSAFTINAASGALAFVGNYSAGTPIAVTVDPTGQYLYAANYGGSSIFGFSINSSTGALTPLSGFPMGDPYGSSPVSLTTDPSGQYLYVAHGTSTAIGIYRIGALGALTGVGSYTDGVTYSAVVSAGAMQ